MLNDVASFIEVFSEDCVRIYLVTLPPVLNAVISTLLVCRAIF